jgi:Flp pilus assembly protein TadG
MKLKFTQNGTSTVEFAMILPFLLIMLFGIMEFGLLLYDKAVITNASREVARSGIAYRLPALTLAELQANGKEVGNRYTQDLKACKSLNPTPSTSYSTPFVNTTIAAPTLASGKPLTVTVSCDYNFMVFGGLYNLFINGSFSNKMSLDAISIMNFE